MKLVIREYLASLKERDELDAVLPDLLTELGFTVYSRPTRGTRQYGVDVAAVGPGQDGIRRVHLFSVKSGDLNRNEWNTASPQSLRPSLDEILDHYIASRIPPEYARLPIAICLTFGGAIDEQVRAEVTGYMTRNTTPKISFEEWNGDRLAEVILGGILREELLPAVQRSHLRKAVAMVEEPDIALDHFQRLLRAIADQPGATPAGRLSQARLINICLWIMFVWAREANNIEAPYRASELALLEVWQLIKTDIARTSKSGEAASLVLNELAELHFTIWDALFEDKILPAAEIRHAISTAVESHAALDINLKLFDLVGRLALRGLWLVWQLSPATGPVVLTNQYLNTLPALISNTTRATVNQIDRLIEAMMAMVSNNRALLSPIGDWQAIDIGLAFTLLACRPGAQGAIDQWAEELAKHSMFAFKAHGRYPITSRSYWDLVDHPSERSDEYRTASTEGSILYPLLALWAAARGEQALFDEIAKFSEDGLAHCTFQTWLPDEDSEDNVYLNRDSHGAALAGIPVTEGTRDTLDFILADGLEPAPRYQLQIFRRARRAIETLLEHHHVGRQPGDQLRIHLGMPLGMDAQMLGFDRKIGDLRHAPDRSLRSFARRLQQSVEDHMPRVLRLIAQSRRIDLAVRAHDVVRGPDTLERDDEQLLEALGGKRQWRCYGTIEPATEQPRQQGAAQGGLILTVERAHFLAQPVDGAIALPREEKQQMIGCDHGVGRRRRACFSQLRQPFGRERLRLDQYRDDLLECLGRKIVMVAQIIDQVRNQQPGKHGVGIFQPVEHPVVHLIEPVELRTRRPPQH